MHDATLRPHVARLLRGQGAHAEPADVLRGLDPELAARRPEGAEHTAWQLLEHLRIAQRDILDFCTDPDYREPSWPDEYWPAEAGPPAPEAWGESADAFLADLEAMCALVEDESTNLAAEIPWSDGATYLREALLLADHNAYHLGQMVMVRRLLGAWPPPPR